MKVLEQNSARASFRTTQKLSDSADAIFFEFKTNCDQDSQYDLEFTEPLVVVFRNDERPLVIPTRQGFPLTPHADFHCDEELLRIGSDTILCIDDRPWSECKHDYSSLELLSRIDKWFARVNSGQMYDAFQVREPAFRPPKQSIVFPTNRSIRELAEEREQLDFLVLSGEKDHFRATWESNSKDTDTKEPTHRFLVLPFGSMTPGDPVSWPVPCTLGQLNSARTGKFYDELTKSLCSIEGRVSPDDKQRFYQSSLMLFWSNEDPERGFQHIALSPLEVNVGALMKLLGLVDQSPDSDTFHRLISSSAPDTSALESLNLAPANLVGGFDIETARIYSDFPPIANQVVLIGAGAIGSLVSENLVREGAFNHISVVDDDILAPHNLARHTLTSNEIKEAKAQQLAARFHSISPGLEVKSYREKFNGNISPDLSDALLDSDVVIDLAASLGCARELSDAAFTARRASAFFNPSGTGLIVMVEDKNRSSDLCCLEAQYYSQILSKDKLSEHLKETSKPLFTGGCRDVTSRIPSSRAALLAASASEIIRELLSKEEAGMVVATAKGGGVETVSLEVCAIQQSNDCCGWTVRLLSGAVDAMHRLRTAALPNETGGSLVGIVDFHRKRIEICALVPAPDDSHATPASFVRGVEGLSETIADAQRRTAGQLSYVGEWHSHPTGTAAPSETDKRLLIDLASDAKKEDRPAVIVIVAENDCRLVLGVE